MTQPDLHARAEALAKLVLGNYTYEHSVVAIASALRQVQEEECEACAKVLDKTVLDLRSVLVDHPKLREVQMAMIDRCLEDAAAIRARGGPR